MTDLDRLKQWMTENNIKASQLAKATKVGHSLVWGMLNDKRNIGDGFKWRIFLAYGDVAFAIFSGQAKARYASQVREVRRPREVRRA